MKERVLLVIFTNAAGGREQEYLDWYDRHLDHMLDLEDCVSAQHFRRVDYEEGLGPHGGGPYDFLAIYEFETDDVPATQARLGARMGSAVMPNSDAKTDTTGAGSMTVPTAASRAVGASKSSRARSCAD